MPKGGEGKREVIVFLLLFAVLGPLAYVGGKMLLDPDLAPIASPVISIVFLFQIACQFDDAIAGSLWPPLVQAAFDMRVAARLNTLLRPLHLSASVVCSAGSTPFFG